MTRYVSTAALLVCCCLPLTACGTEHAGTRADGAAGAAGSSVGDATGDDQGTDLPDTTTDDQHTDLPDTTSDDQHTDLPDTTSDDQHTGLPDTTTDDQHSGPDTTSDDQGYGPPMGDTTDDSEDAPSTGPHRWFPMLREFRAYLTTKAPKADAVHAAHVESVYVRTPEGSARATAVVHVDYGVDGADAAERTAEAFTAWRRTAYGDHGHVEVLGPGKTTVERDW
ncbi:hypothetical protein ABZ858_06280 [Streptomyces sp. NPDC047017]|uniref:hypothetical protein n=1 Tax=Streptomyces sp. NPDC047017 TaxID=3155024 RepID=UPI0033D67286